MHVGEAREIVRNDHQVETLLVHHLEALHLEPGGVADLEVEHGGHARTQPAFARSNLDGVTSRS
jgi:hypothetical protein